MRNFMLTPGGCERDQNAGVRLALASYSRLVAMSLTGLSLSSTRRTQKSLRPGPLMTAPRRTFRSERWRKVGIGELLEARGDVLDRVVIVIDKADTEIAQTGAIDDGAAKDILPLVERERLGDRK